MSVIHTPRKPELDLRLVAFPAVMGLALTVLFLRLWYFQVVLAPELEEKADASREIKVTKPAPRGLIYDRNGVLVAAVRPEIVVTAIPAVVQKNPKVLDEVASILKVDVSKLEAKVKDAAWRRYVPTPIYMGAPVEAGTRIAEAGDDLPGIGVESQSMRYYPDTVSFTHVLGYVWTPTKDEVKRLTDQGLTPAEYIGKQGVERAYETDLMGEPGDERMEIDAKRRPVRVVGRDNPIPGKRLVLTLDADLQKYATSLMGGKGYKGAVVALEPKTGEVLCLVSSPTYDERVFENGISQADWRQLNEDPNKPMLDRSVQSAYAPGSTFKLITSLAAYRAGKFDPNFTVYCDGGFHLGHKIFRCEGHHGAITFERALEKSCNTYFATLGNMVGRERLVQAAEDMGLGSHTGIEIGDRRGDLPTESWLKRNRRPAVWYGGDAINASIGQGADNATPLQMACVASLVANDGASYVPHLVREIKDPTGETPPQHIQPQVAHSVTASPEFWSILKDAMTRVVESGTAQSARINGVVWAGKTGSAEHGHAFKTHSWFIGFAPVDNPKIAICAMVESAGQGGEVAAPIARDIVQRYLLRAERKKAAAPSTSLALASSAPSR